MPPSHTPRRAAAVLATLTMALVALSVPAAHAAVPGAQSAALTDGTAILRYDARQTTKSALVGRLRTLALPGVAMRKLPLVAVRGSRAELLRAAGLQGVVGAHMNAPIEFDLYQSTRLLYGGTEQRDKLFSHGFDGSGVNVAVLDSGVDGLHPDLAKRVVRNVKVLADLRPDIGAPAYVVCPAACNTDTSGGHGTHVSGIAVGDGTASDGFYTGVAPGAGIVGLAAGEGANILWAVAAFDYLLANPGLGVVAVNNSWGQSQSEGHGRFDATDPVNVATKALYQAGVASVFSAGNTGTGDRVDEPGASLCDTVVENGERVAGPGICRFTVYGSAPWAFSVAGGRKDGLGGAGQQVLGTYSSRGDTAPRIALDGSTVSYEPTVTAPGTNVRSARDPNGVTQVLACGSAEPPACTSSPKPESEPFYHPLSGTSMAAPHVTGAIAVVQGAARKRLGRLLTPDEVKSVLQRSAAPMTLSDGFYDWPCGEPLFIACGTNGYQEPNQSDSFPQYSGTPYERYQVGAGHLDVAAALGLVQAMKPGRPKRPKAGA